MFGTAYRSAKKNYCLHIAEAGYAGLFLCLHGEGELLASAPLKTRKACGLLYGDKCSFLTVFDGRKNGYLTVMTTGILSMLIITFTALL
jgi:hypothetical protein